MKRKHMITGVTLLALTATSISGGLAYAKSSMERGMGGGMERPSFETLDTNGDGQVTVIEIKEAGAQRFQDMDTNGDGLLSVEELQAPALEQAKGRSERMITRMIEWRDSDGDGQLSQAELGTDMGERMFMRLDADEDGVITAEEFAAIDMERGKGPHRGSGKGHGKDFGRHGGDRMAPGEEVSPPPAE